MMDALLILLLPILIQIESNGDDKAIGDHGAAVGCMQIHEIMVDDVNRILGGNYFSYADRLNRKKSKEMAAVYFYNYKGRGFDKLTTREQLIQLGRQWNGGPNGHHKKATQNYGLKIKAIYLEKVNGKVRH